VRRTRPYLAGVSALAVGLCPLALHSQIPEALGGVWIDGTLNFRLESEDGEPEFRTGFDLGLSTATRTQLLRFSGDFGLTVPLEDIDTADFDDPRYQLEYLRDNGQSRISASAFIETSDIDGTAVIFDPGADPGDFDEIELVEDDGTRERRQLSLGLEWGLRDPVGGTLVYDVNETEYSGTNDPDLVDSRSTAVSGSLRLDADRTLSFVIDALHRLTEEEANLLNPETETEVVRAGLGTQWQMTPVLLLDGRLGWSEITETLTVGSTSFIDEEEGAEIALAFTLDRPNGSWALGYDRALTGVGAQDTLRLTRELALPRGAVVTASLGARYMPSGETYAIGSFDYGRDTRRGRIGLSASRDAEVNSDDFEVLRSRLRASYSEDLPDGASWTVSGSFFESDFTNPAEPDLATGQLSLNYARPLTPEWDLSGGIRLRETHEEGEDTDRSTTVFLSLERQFRLRP
jgi:hypothetical protein